MFRLGLPKLACWHNLGYDLARPKSRSIDVSNGVLGNPFLFFRGIEDSRTVAGADVIALTIASGRIVNLKEKLKELSIAQFGGIDNFYRFCMVAMISVGGVGTSPPV
jgi:hypothetical protein